MRFSLVLIALSLLTFSGPGAAPARADDSATSGPAFRAAVEKEAFSLVNQYRKANDLRPLGWDEEIAKVARGHSKDMATGAADFGHGGFRDRVDRLKGARSGFRGAGENVLMTDDLREVARKAVTLWLHSPPHLKNIRGDFNYSGLGVWQKEDGTIYFTQVFMKFEPPMAPPSTSPSLTLAGPFGMVASPVCAAP
jgi:uncharacterized protein YkwD